MTGQFLAVIPWAVLAFLILLALRGTGPTRQHRAVPIPVDRHRLGPDQRR